MKANVSLAVASTLFLAVIANPVPLLTKSEFVPGSYIVKLNPLARGSIDTHLDLVKALFTERSNENRIESVYSNIGNLYHAKFSNSVLEKVRGLPGVEYVEQDGISKLATVQSSAPWGLARVSQRAKLPLTGKLNYTYNADGAGVSVYVLDTGTFVDHPEFEGRARWGANFATTNNTDDNGHGTHCAGTIGSKTYGVAKKAEIVAIKVCSNLGCFDSNIISGINWALKDKKGAKGNVISLSIQGPKQKALNDAVESAHKNGFVVAVAAGNYNKDACDYSPASAPSVLTVAASDEFDNRANFSNFGSCVDVFGPGVDIESTWKDGSTETISGTSMATPHVAGLAAYFLSQGSFTNTQIVDKIIALATKNAIKDVQGSPNLLIYNSVV